jgi:uncharacterized protein YndB with AHSA1/START domain
MEFEITTLIDRSVAKAFEACNSAKMQIAWMGSLVEVTIPDGTVWGTGAKFKQIHEESGVRQEFDGIVLDFVPNERIEFEMKHSDFTVQTEILFEDLGEHCRITQSSSIELHSMALKLARSMIRGVLERRFDEDHVRLKALVEGS